MNERIDSALQDITVIRETLDDTKVHYRGMYLMCFVMAAFNGVKYLWALLKLWFMPQMMVGGILICYLWPLCLVASYLCIYRREKKYSNKYYLSMQEVASSFQNYRNDRDSLNYYPKFLYNSESSIFSLLEQNI